MQQDMKVMGADNAYTNEQREGAEMLIDSMRDETVRMLQYGSCESRVAWYWSYIGALDFARLSGLIAEEHRQELVREMMELKPERAAGAEVVV